MRRSGLHLRRLFLLAVAPLPLLAAIAPGLFLDPLLSVRAATALTGDTEAAFAATRETGHWISWAWSKQSGQLSLETLIGLFYVGWGLYCASLAQAVFREDAKITRAMVLAAALMLAPPAADLAFALPDAIPTVWLIAVHALLVLVLPVMIASALLPFAVALMMMTDASLAPLPLATHVLGLTGPRFGHDDGILLRSLGLFLIGGTLGAVCVFALNDWQHGVFGMTSPIAVPLAEDEERLSMIGTWLSTMLRDVPVPLVVAALGGAVAAFITLFLINSREGDRLLGALVIALLVLFGQALLSGEAPPSRGLLVPWVLLLGALATAARAAGKGALGSVFILLVLAALAAGGSQWHAIHAPLEPLRASTRALATEIQAQITSAAATNDASEPRLLAIGGSPSQIDGGEGLREYGQLALRLRQLTGIAAVQCPGADPVCNQHQIQLATMPKRPDPGWVATAPDGVILIRLPDGIFAPVRP
ncbi:MAG: hypothetical protein AAGC57_16555 [Pseudomonadota bacterium]